MDDSTPFLGNLYPLDTHSLPPFEQKSYTIDSYYRALLLPRKGNHSSQGGENEKFPSIFERTYHWIIIGRIIELSIKSLLSARRKLENFSVRIFLN